MQIFVNYLITLVWAIVVALTMAVAYGFAIWILERMLSEIKGLRHVFKKPIAAAIVYAGFILGAAIIVTAIYR